MSSLDLTQLPADPSEEQAAAGALNTETTFAYVSNNTLDSITGQHGLPGDLGAPIKDYVWKSQQAAQNGVRSLQVVLGAPHSAPVADPNTRQILRGTVYPDAGKLPMSVEVLNRVAGDINRLESEAQQEAVRLVKAVYRASAETDLPRYGASETRQAELKADMTQLLEGTRDPQVRQVEVINLLRKLVADGDDEGLSVLLGKRMELVRQRLGLDDDLLANRLFWARMERVNNDPNALGAPKYARFLSSQEDPTTSLGAVAANAAARLRHAHAYAKSRTPRR